MRQRGWIAAVRRALLALPLVTACAAPLPPVGSVHVGQFMLEGRIVPLPPGEWRVIGNAATEPVGGALRFTRVALVQDKDGRVAGTVGITANSPDTSTGPWSTPLAQNACRDESANIAVLTRQGSPNGWDCGRVVPWVGTGARPATLQPQWIAFFDRRDRDPGTSAAIYHDVRLSLADRIGLIHVDYEFSPETRGFPRDARPWAQNVWNPRNQCPAQREYLARLVAWGHTVQPLIRAGFYSAQVTAPEF